MSDESRPGSVPPTHDADDPSAAAPVDDQDVVADESDKDSDVLSEIDEDQFGDLDDEVPKEIDEDAIKSLKPAKRKTVDDGGAARKKARRPKKRAHDHDDDHNNNNNNDDDDDDDDDDAVDAANIEEGVRRPRKARAPGRPAPRKEAEPAEEPDENLTPEERRRRALERVMERAAKSTTRVRRRKKDAIDLEQEMDEQIASLKVRMETACVADNSARNAGQAATHKLQLLPEVVALLHRTQIQDAVLDPETNLLQSVKYFLEPLDDGSLPAYTIQRDVLAALQRLPVTKDMLLSSGIGKVVLFYTRSKRAEPSVKRMAEKLVGEWSRPVLKRTDDYKKRQIETREFDPNAANLRQRQELAVSSSQFTLSQRPAKSKTDLERERLLAPERAADRARPQGLPPSYTVAPKSTYNASDRSTEYRPIGAAGTEAFRKMTQKGKGGRR
ncbi:hypothetical protein P8C59_007693 [Phyllachora maydis]|uniref:TFIIS N-terminal domain-containing protein n=1 Tax=Phyllachora maydis TaxID=1825666 RepID=A0AAD9I990_9PEZI|nr:hypothetical protein P8C59_007693 [Phyllachora maydis]